ncbi:MAG: hypothetical protein M0R74_01535 [Dehalococcoidia bacterium]|nr:hypothetical protein [Dehalococcoidia bacterium]
MQKLHQDDRAQDALEYLLVIGGFVVLLVLGLLAFDSLIVDVVGLVCPSVDTANPAVAVGSCLGIS